MAELESTEAKTSSGTYDHTTCHAEAGGRSQKPSETWIGSQDQRSRYAAFFYCKRAEVLYSKLPYRLQADDQVQDARASALTQIGQILDDTRSARNLHPLASPQQPPTEDDRSWSCDVIQDNNTQKAHWLFHQKGPYTSLAKAYYEQANVIKPDDWKARCYFAIDSQALRRIAPMEKLDADNSIHNVAGNTWWRLAGETDPKSAAPLYTNALVEFERAVELFPEDVRSLNDFAYTVWQWHLRSHLSAKQLQREFEQWRPKNGNADKTKDKPTIDELAETFARKAVSLTQHSDMRTSLIMKSTLQEVLLAKAYWGDGSFQDAAEILKDGIPPHPYFDELRWDQAQAKLCTNPGREEEKEADKLLQAIANNEARREVRPYTDQFKLLTPQCQLEKESPAPPLDKATAHRAHSPEQAKDGQLNHVVAAGRSSR